MESAAWGLIGTAVGALASIATTWLTAQSTSKREMEKLREDRLERARAFQRQTLLELQDAIYDALRLTVRTYTEDLKAAKDGNPWGKTPLSAEVNEGLMLANRRVSILVERVVDDELRAKVKSLMQASTHITYSRSKDEAEFGMKRSDLETPPVFELIGQLLRKYY